MESAGKDGARRSPLPILFGAATFEFWALDTETGQSSLLDTTTVNGFYNPTVRIETIDPNDTPLARRTRADIPYNVFVDGIDAPYRSAAASQLAMMWTGEGFDGGQFGVPSGYEPNFANGVLISSLLSNLMSDNGVSTATSLSANSSSQLAGVETYSVWEPNPSTGEPQLLNIHEIEVWPTVVVGFRQGAEIESGATYSRFDPVRIDINNLYANDTWAISVRNNSNGDTTLVQQGAVTGDAPQSRSVTITNLADHLSGAGEYTLIIEQQAPGLDPVPREHLVVSFTYNPSIDVRGAVFSN